MIQWAVSQHSSCILFSCCFLSLCGRPVVTDLLSPLFLRCWAHWGPCPWPPAAWCTPCLGTARRQSPSPCCHWTGRRPEALESSWGSLWPCRSWPQTARSTAPSYSLMSPWTLTDWCLRRIRERNKLFFIKTVVIKYLNISLWKKTRNFAQ